MPSNTCAVCGPATIVTKAWIKADDGVSLVTLCTSCVENLLGAPRCQRCGQPKGPTSNTREIHVKGRTSVPICDDCHNALLADVPAGAESRWDTMLQFEGPGWSE